MLFPPKTMSITFIRWPIITGYEVKVIQTHFLFICIIYCLLKVE